MEDDASGPDTQVVPSSGLSARALPVLPTPPIPLQSPGEDSQEEADWNGATLPQEPKLVGTRWTWRLSRARAVAGFAHGAEARMEAKLERMRKMLTSMLDRNMRQQLLFLWRLNATRSKASALAVWAVDQGNRKAYEVERSLMADNTWATRSVIWEGYRHSTLVGLSDSSWFWTVKADDNAMGVERLREELALVRARTDFLAAQLNSARQQLMDWQELAEFENVDGSWQSMRILEAERQARAARAANSGLVARPASPPPGEESSWAEERRSNLHNWMMGYRSDREIRSTIPGSPTSPLPRSHTSSTSATQRTACLANHQTTVG